MLYNLKRLAKVKDAEKGTMNEEEMEESSPVSVVRFGLGKEIQLFPDELVVLQHEEGRESHVSLQEVRWLILTPGDPNPAKLVLMADLEDDSTVVLAEGINNARDLRTLISHIRELAPHIQFDPPNMEEQLLQAINNRRMHLLILYGVMPFVWLVLCIVLWLLYLLIAYLGAHHH
jgi:hypothetical protein